MPCLCNDIVQLLVQHQFLKEVGLSFRRLADMVALPGLKEMQKGMSILCGSDQIWKLSGHTRQWRKHNGLTTVETTAGWTFQGPVSRSSNILNTSCMVCILHSQAIAIQDSATNVNLINSLVLKTTQFSSEETDKKGSAQVLQELEAFVCRQWQWHEMSTPSIGESRAPQW